MRLAKSSSYMRTTEARCMDNAKFRKNLLAGRKCESDFECLSHDCQSGFCKGKSSGKSCASHEECDAGLACNPQSDFPYNTFCQGFKNIDEPCMDDFECTANMVCWYRSTDDLYKRTRRCMTYYGLANGTTFGWATTHHDQHLDVL